MLQDPFLVPDLVNDLCLKDFLHTINLFLSLRQNFKVYHAFIYWEPVVAMNFSASRRTLERHPYSEGDPAMQRAAILKSSRGPWLPTTYGIKWDSHICISIVCLDHCHTQVLAALLLNVPQGPQSDGCSYHIPTGGYGLNTGGKYILTGM